MNSSILFYFTGVYLFRSRPHAAVSLFFTHLIPITYLFCVQSGFTLQTLSLSLLILVIIQNVYEIGYIQNDTETIKKDINPTLRISEKQMDFYKSHRLLIYFFRLLSTTVLLALLHAFFSYADIFIFVMGLLALLIVFLLYNNYRGHVTMLLYFVLSSLRYIVPFMLFPENISIALVILLLMIHPFARTLEFKCSKPPYITTNICFRRYIIGFDMSRIHWVRVIVYFFLCVLTTTLYTYSFFPVEYLWIMLYILTFRILIYIYYLLRKNPIKS